VLLFWFVADFHDEVRRRAATAAVTAGRPESQVAAAGGARLRWWRGLQFQNKLQNSNL
jgi:hypothetical protein